MRHSRKVRTSASQSGLHEGLEKFIVHDFLFVVDLDEKRTYTRDIVWDGAATGQGDRMLHVVGEWLERAVLGVLASMFYYRVGQVAWVAWLVGAGIYRTWPDDLSGHLPWLTLIVVWIPSEVGLGALLIAAIAIARRMRG